MARSRWAKRFRRRSRSPGSWRMRRGSSAMCARWASIRAPPASMPMKSRPAGLGGRSRRAHVAPSHRSDPMTYDPIYAESIADPAGFWMKAAEAIDWDVAPTRAGDPQDDGMWRWFPDGRLNTCHNALDRHVAAGRGDRVALVHDSEIGRAHV